jgi:hypothetical protein
MTDNLPAFVAELEALEAKATPGLWQIDPLKGPAVQPFVVALRNHAPALLALVRQLAAERDDLAARLEVLKGG